MEKFTFSSPARVIRKKTFSSIQKSILSLLWIVVTACMIGGITLQQHGVLPNTTPMLLASILLPLVGAAIVMILLVKNPRGPERDFVIPAVETGADDSSTLAGKIRTADGKVVEVVVTVPNVYGAVDELGDSGSGFSGTAKLAHAEMADMALEEVQRRYPTAQWSEFPSVVE